MTDQPVLEKHTIGYVPPSDRHGRPRDLFTLWFGTNIAPLPVVTGAAGVTVFGLDLVSCVIAIVVGHLVGGIFMALHSAQGPQMGIPQMIQSRGQFGSYGALIVVAIAAVMYLAFFASNIVLAGQSLHGIAEPVPVSWGIVLGALGSGLICVIGYRFIHALNKVATWVLGIAIVRRHRRDLRDRCAQRLLDSGLVHQRRFPGHGEPRGSVADRLRAVRL